MSLKSIVRKIKKTLGVRPDNRNKSPKKRRHKRARRAAVLRKRRR